MSGLVQFSKVFKNYNGKKVIDDVSFTIQERTITTLIGPNGAGKTTIARLLLNIEKPSAGKIVRNTKKISYIPQKLHLNTKMPLDVKSYIECIIGSKFVNLDKLDGITNIGTILTKQLKELSGGQLQRVLLTAAILSKPDLIVLDEPTQGLDVQGQNDFYNLITELKKNYKITIFIISHDLHIVIKNADQVLCLNHHICCSGKPEEKQLYSDLSQVGSYQHHHDHRH